MSRFGFCMFNFTTSRLLCSSSGRTNALGMYLSEFFHSQHKKDRFYSSVVLSYSAQCQTTCTRFGVGFMLSVKSFILYSLIRQLYIY